MKVRHWFHDFFPISYLDLKLNSSLKTWRLAYWIFGAFSRGKTIVMASWNLDKHNRRSLDCYFGIDFCLEIHWIFGFDCFSPFSLCKKIAFLFTKNFFRQIARQRRWLHSWTWCFFASWNLVSKAALGRLPAHYLGLHKKSTFFRQFDAFWSISWASQKSTFFSWNHLLFANLTYFRPSLWLQKIHIFFREIICYLPIWRIFVHLWSFTKIHIFSSIWCIFWALILNKWQDHGDEFIEYFAHQADLVFT